MSTVNYLVCATPRTGSYLLCDLLIQTGVAGRPTEYLSAGYQSYWAPRWGTPDYPDYLRRVRRIGTGPNGVFGGKAHPRQFRWFATQALGRPNPTYAERAAAFAEWFPDCRYVWLRRRDVHRQAFSWAKSMQTNIWWDASEAPAPYDRPMPEALRFDSELLRRALEQMRREDRMWGDYFAANAIDPLEIWYEDFTADTAATLRRVLTFLGLSDQAPAAAPAPSFKRQSDAATERWLSRFATLERARADANLSGVAGVDTADMVLASGALLRPSGWQEARHSLFVVEPYAGPFKPDYALVEPGVESTTRPEVSFVRGAADSVIPPSGIRLALGPVRAARPPADLAAEVAAHVGATRIGILARGRGVFDVAGTRVLPIAGTGEHDLDLDGFLDLPPLPPFERRPGRRLRLAVDGDTDWGSSLINAVNALTRHTARDHDPDADIVITERDLGDRAGSATVVRVGPARDTAELELSRADAGSVRVPWPLDWWIRAYRPLAKDPAAPLVYIVEPADADHVDVDLDLDLVEKTVRAATTARVVRGPVDGDLELLRGSSVLVDVTRSGGVAAARGLARGSVVVAAPGRGWPQIATDRAPVVRATLDGLGWIVARLGADPGELSARGERGREWLRHNWDFTRQWDRFWVPALRRAVTAGGSE